MLSRGLARYLAIDQAEFGAPGRQPRRSNDQDDGKRHSAHTSTSSLVAAQPTPSGKNDERIFDGRHPKPHGRYQFWPEAGEHSLNAGEEATKSADYLSEELLTRIAADPVRFTWYAQIAEDSDVIDDPATPWPDYRQRVPLGGIVIDQVGPNSPEADRSLAFMPGNLAPGIEIADPMLTIRNASHPQSFQERNR